MMFFDKIKQLENELKGKTNIKVGFISGEPMPDGYYDIVFEESELRLKSIFETIFNQFEFLQFKTFFSDRVIAETNIDGLIMSFNSVAQEHYIHAFDEFGEEFKTFARQFYPFDIYRESLDEVTLTVIKIIDKEHLELWIWNNSGQKYKLKFKSIEEYLEAGVACKFVVHWQYFYIDTDALDFSDPFTKEWIAFSYSDSISRMNDALTTMKEHFPQEDWSYQEKELERVKGINDKK